jgi:hypothetical protein
MATNYITAVYTTGSETFTKVDTYTDDTAIVIDADLTASTPDTWAGAIDVSQLACLMIEVTGGAVTVKATNSGGATLFGGAELAAGTTLIYGTQALAAAALGGSDITALYFAPGAANATVKIRGITNLL